jgi:dienelactone hydrolase
MPREPMGRRRGGAMVAACAAAALALAACRRSIPDPPPSPAKAGSTVEYFVREAELLDGAVPVKAEIPLVPGRKPAVIGLIGNTRPFIDAGFVAVTYSIYWLRLKDSLPPPPAAEHAVGKWVLLSPSADLLGERYLREIATTARTVVPAVLDWMSAQPEIDPTRMGMTGASTNGFITLQAAAVDRRLDVAVVLAGCGDYHRFLRESSMGIPGHPPLALEPEYEQWVRAQEVINDPQPLLHAAVLMVNRTGDELVPVSCADETARVLQDAYADAGVPERFRYVRLEQPGHGIGPDELNAMNAWFQRWFKDADQ